MIGVTVKAGETDSGNDFVDSNNDSIIGTVKDDNGNPLSEVPFQLSKMNPDGSYTAFLTTKTDSKGAYSFDDLEPGDYRVVETNLDAYLKNVSDNNTTNDGDPTDTKTAVDNTIGVRLVPGETDDGNDFVDSDNGRVGALLRATIMSA